MIYLINREKNCTSKDFLTSQLGRSFDHNKSLRNIILLLQMDAFGNLYLTANLLPLAVFKTYVDFSKD